jgi:hypothetical protein
MSATYLGTGDPNTHRTDYTQYSLQPADLETVPEEVSR